MSVTARKLRGRYLSGWCRFPAHPDDHSRCKRAAYPKDKRVTDPNYEGVPRCGCACHGKATA